jgi:hypothetical protein
VREIELTRGKVALVDDDDYASISRHRWRVMISKTGNYYALRSPRIDGKKRTIMMHREILGLEYGDPMQGDHGEPTETLNNQRYNLRIATRSQNQQNKRKCANSTTGFKGVIREKGKRDGWFRAQITVNKRNIILGSRRSAEEASELYAAGAIKYHGEFARAE